MSGLTSPGFDPACLLRPDAPAKPRITVSDDAWDALTVGRTFTDVTPGSKEFTDKRPVMALNERIRTPDGALRLQLAYRTLHTRFVKPSPPGRRLAMLNHAATDKHGVKHVTVEGLLADWAVELVRYDKHGKPLDRDAYLEAARRDSTRGVYDATRVKTITRVCLLAPTAVSRDDAEVIDSHLWLNTFDIQPGGGVDALYVGEYVTVDMEILGYTDRNGIRRLGAGVWTPVCSSVDYNLNRVDGSTTLLHVPSHLVTRLRLARIDGGHAVWAEPGMLDGELARLERQWPDMTSRLELKE